MEQGRRKQLEEEWENLFTITKSAVDAWDPYGLLGESHCPPDEYDSESYEAALRIRNSGHPAAQEIAQILSEVFTQWFGDPECFRPENCRKVAERIAEEIRQSVQPAGEG